MAAPPRFTIQDLGPAPPAINGFPVMNDLGQVSFMQRNGALALYTDGVGVENPIPWVPVGSGLMPAGINNRGDIVFNHRMPGQFNVTSQLYQAGIGLTIISNDFVASDINNEGVIVGSRSSTAIPRVYRNGLLENLPLPLGSSAQGINDGGQVVGRIPAGGDAFHAYSFDPETGLADLGTLGGAISAAGAVNNAGAVVGTSQALDGLQRLFLYTPEHGMRDLGNVPGAGGRVNEWELDINDAGMIVGFAWGPNSEQTPFLFADNALTDLNALVDSSQGWSFQMATAINNQGQIAGIGRIGGEYHAYRLTPTTSIPEPGTLNLLALALPALALPALARTRRQTVQPAARD